MEPMQSAHPNTSTPWRFDFDLDPESLDVLRFAAWIGSAVGGEFPVRFTSLFIAVCRARNADSNWLLSILEQNGVDLDRVEKDFGLDDSHREVSEKQAASGDWPGPGEKTPPKISSSAEKVLNAAADLARQTAVSEETAIQPLHLIAAFLFKAPADHRSQLEGWGIRAASLQEAFQAYLNETRESSASEWLHALGLTPVDEPGDAAGKNIAGEVLTRYRCDPQALFVLRAAVELARHLASVRKRKRVVTTNILFFTLAESGFGEETFEPARRFREILVSAPSPELEYESDFGSYAGTPGSLPEIAKPPSAFDPSESLPWLSPNAKAILDEAASYTNRFEAMESGRIGVLHLVVALILNYREDRGKPKRNRLKLLNLTQRRIREEYYYAMRGGLSGTQSEALERLLIGVSEVYPTAFANDRPDGDDRLDVRRFARALAGVVATRQVEPPLSIGVFGDWGSGKSFFMDLMDKEVEAITQDKRLRADGERMFCEHIVPIKFNAWQYADTNLWASLVYWILTRLEEHISGPEKDSPQWNELMQRLEISGTLYSEAQKKHRQAEIAYKEAERKYHQVAEQTEEKAESLQTLKKMDVIRGFAGEIFKAEDLGKLADEASRLLGFKNLDRHLKYVAQTKQDAYDLVNDSRVVAARSRTAIDWLIKSPLETRDWIFLLLITAGILAAGGVLYFKSLEFMKSGSFAAMTTFLAEAAAVVTMALAWARKRLGAISSLMDRFDAVRAGLEGELRERRRKNEADVQREEAALKEKKKELQKARTGLDKADQTRKKALQNLEESTSARRLANYIQRRLTERDYEKQLGIISAIRSDFDTIGKFLAESRDPSQRAAARIVSERRAGRGLAKPVDRIMLFIDDLDRCPAGRVVNVLEAIHLLLAFPIFVVVVGVDVRWVVSSLHRKYPNHLSEATFIYGNDRSPSGATQNDAGEPDAPSAYGVSSGGLIAGDGSAGRATALDYIEKIFQIPFWLPPMTKTGSQNLIGALLQYPSPEAPGRDASGDGSQKNLDRGKTVDRDKSAESETISNGILAPGPAESKLPGDGEKNLQGDVSQAQRTSKANSGEEQTQENTEANERSLAAQGMEIGAEEQNFMLSLAGTTGRSPRRLKRFVNSYRVLKASCTPLEREEFVVEKGKKGTYRAAMALLAITTGSPTLANRFLRWLSTSDPGFQMESLKQKVNQMSGSSSERGNIVDAMDIYVAHTAAVSHDPMSDLRMWAPKVARFTFRSGRL